MTFKEKPIPRNHESLGQKAEAIKQVYYYQDYHDQDYRNIGSPNLRVFLDEFAKDFRETAGVFSPQIIMVEGIPGSGKSYLANSIIRPYLTEKLEDAVDKISILHWDTQEKNLVAMLEKTHVAMQEGKPYSWGFKRLVAGMVKARHPELTPGHKSFKENFEQEAVNLLSLRIIHGEPYSQEFLFSTNVLMRMRMADLIKKSGPRHLIIVDKPGGTYLPASGHQDPASARDYGAGFFWDLYLGEDFFKGIKGKRLRMGHVSVVPGPMIDLLVIARHLIQEARLKKNKQEALTAANRITYLFGLDRFSSWEDLWKFPVGGSVAQVERAKSGPIDIVGQMEDFRNLTYDFLRLPTSIKLVYAASSRLNTLESFLVWWRQNIRDPQLEKIIANAREVAELTGKSPLTAIRESLMMLASARVLELLGQLTDHRVILYNNPDLPIPDELALKDFLRRNL
ncbi:hypothetical protein HY439_01565 [Candidatus Microgenomates bacterium]|nr:hypothetical protein [Candidatus Microgenomates bacterium]